MEQQLEVTRSVKLSTIFILECIVSTETLSFKVPSSMQFQTVHTFSKLIHNPLLINNPLIK